MAFCWQVTGHLLTTGSEKSCKKQPACLLALPAVPLCSLETALGLLWPKGHPSLADPQGATASPHLPLAAPPRLEVVEARATVAAVPPGHMGQAGALAGHWVAGRPPTVRAPGVAVAGCGGSRAGCWGQARSTTGGAAEAKKLGSP